MATLPGLSVGLTLNSATFIAETRRVEGAVRSVGRTVEQQSTIINRGFNAAGAAAKSLAAGLLAGLGAASLAGIAGLAKRSLDAAGNLKELAASAGVSATQLQVLTLAGTQAGLSQEQLVTAIGLFNRNIGEALKGTGTFADTLTRVGIGIRDANGNIRSSGDLLSDYADAVQNAGSEQEKLSLLQEAFGRSGRALINILSGGSAGLQAFAAQAEAAGLIISDEFIEQADQASDAIATLQLATQRGFQIGLIKAFGDAVSSSADALTRARQAGELFGRLVGTAINIVISAFKKLRPFIATTIKEFNAIKGVLQQFGLVAQDAQAGTEALSAELAVFGGAAEDSAEGIVEATDAAKEHAKTLADAVEQAQRENEQLIALKAAHDGYGSSVKIVNKAIEIDNALRAAKITRQEAEESGLLALLVANQNLTEAIKEQTDAEEFRLKAAGESFDELAKLTQQTLKDVNEEQRRQAEKAEELMLEPFKNALENIQGVFTDTFEEIFNGTIDNFKDLGSAIKDIFIRLAAEIATLMVIRPVLAGLPTGLGGGGGGFGAITGLADLFKLGGGGGLTPGLPGARPGDITGFNPAAAGSSWGSLFATGAVGALAGSFIGPLIFGGRGQSGFGGGIGGGAGAAAGFALGGPFGALAGGLLGSVGGGFLGSFFGGGADDNEGDLRFSTGRGSVFDPGVFGSLTIGGENSFRGPLTDIIRQFDQGVSQFLTVRQRELATQAVQALDEYEGRFPEADPSEGFGEILKERAGAILKAAFSKINVDKVLEGASGVEEIGQRVEVALKTITTFNELTGEMASPAEQLENALDAVRANFADIRPIARALGLDIGLLNKAMREQLNAVRESFVSIQELTAIQNQIARNTRAAFRDDLARAGPLTNKRALKLDLRAVGREFFERRLEAKELGIPLDEVRRAERAAREEVKRQHKERRISERQLARAEEEARKAGRLADARAIAEQRAARERAAAEEAEAAREKARVDAINRQALIDQLTEFLPGASPLELELRGIDREFRELGRQAEELGVSLDLVRNAAKAAREAAREENRQRINEVRQRIEELRETGEPESVRQFNSALRNLNDQFREVMEAARELGISVGDLAEDHKKAVAELRKSARLELEDQALTASRQFDAILNPLREFQQELTFSTASPVEQFRLAREEFERIAGLARAGDLSAISALPQAGRLFLEQAGTFGASPARVEAERQIQEAINAVIQKTTDAQERATEGLENEIRRASEREIDKLAEMVEQGRETVRELKRLRDAIGAASRTA